MNNTTAALVVVMILSFTEIALAISVVWMSSRAVKYGLPTNHPYYHPTQNYLEMFAKESLMGVFQEEALGYILQGKLFGELAQLLSNPS